MINMAEDLEREAVELKAAPPSDMRPGLVGLGQAAYRRSLDFGKRPPVPLNRFLTLFERFP